MLFFLDIYMPGISGIEFAQEIRKNGIEVPIVFLTISKDHALEAFGVGATQYLIKPFPKQSLFRALDEVIEKINKINHK